jgi:3,4-dihydroxy 2-butanone 4-phosphate synthase/GTP cyclohydrolase II
MNMRTEKIFGITLYVGSMPVETRYGVFTAYTFQNLIHKGYIIALCKGDLQHSLLYTRIHSSCVTSETLRSLDCDCVLQLEGALQKIAEKEHGVLFYLIQEGRGCGYVGKSRACMWVQHSNDQLTTFDAYKMLGMKDDYRDYSNIKEAAYMLEIEKTPFVLLTNNPDKINGFRQAGLILDRVESIEVSPSPFNQSYLLSKQEMGHLLYKTKKKDSRFKYPFKKITPFVPYSLPDCSRFIHCASYYLPIKPVDRKMVCTQEEVVELRQQEVPHAITHDIDGDRFLVQFFELADVEVKPYWFQVHMYYDLASNYDFVLLTYGRYKEKTPVVRVHSESLFGRFPLARKLDHYKEKYKQSVEEIVKNDSGALLLLHRDGRGAGLSHYILSHSEGASHSGIKTDSRDYDAVAQLLRHHLQNQPIRMLYSGSSRVSLAKAFSKEKIKVVEWIDLEPKDQEKGHQIISQRIEDAPHYLMETQTPVYSFDPTCRYWVTGVGSSEAHARYLVHLVNRYHKEIRIHYLPITACQRKEEGKIKLIVCSQGLSPVVMRLLFMWNYEDVVLLTSVTPQNSNDKKIEVLRNLHTSGSLVVPFPLEDEYRTLLRTIGPLVGYGVIYQMVLGTSFSSVQERRVYSLLKNAKQHLPPVSFFQGLDGSAQIVILASHPLTSFLHNLVYKLTEGAFIRSVQFMEYLEFPHGAYQNMEYQRHHGVMTHFILLTGAQLEKEVLRRARSLLGNESPVWEIYSELSEDLQILEYEMIFNYFTLQLIERKKIDQVNWFGKDRQHLLYEVDSWEGVAETQKREAPSQLFL